MTEHRKPNYRKQSEAYAEAEREETKHGFFIEIKYDENGIPVALRKSMGRVEDTKHEHNF